MKRVFYLLPFLSSCAALRAPVDPANPAGPEVIDAVAQTVATVATAVNPLWGGVIAAAVLGGVAAWKKKA